MWLPSNTTSRGASLLQSDSKKSVSIFSRATPADATHTQRIVVRDERHSAVRVREGLDHCQASGGPPADGSTIERRRDARGIEEHVGNVFMHRAEVASRELPSQLGERLGAAGICAGLYVEFEPDDADLVRALHCLVDVETEGTSEPAASRRSDIVVGVEAHIGPRGHVAAPKRDMVHEEAADKVTLVTDAGGHHVVVGKQEPGVFDGAGRQNDAPSMYGHAATI